MRFNDKLSYLTVFGVVSGLLGFIVDLVAFFRIFGVDLIIAPASSPPPSHPQPLVVELPASAEVVTFIIWLYTAIVVLVASIWFRREFSFTFDYGEVWYGLLLCLFCALVPALLAVWLWGFGYVPVWLYVFLLPTMTFIGISWYLGLNIDEPHLGCVVMFLTIGPALLWFRSGCDWAFIWIIAITFVSWLIGSVIGSLPGFYLSEW